MSAMSIGPQLYGREVGAPPRRVDALDLHDDRVAAPHRQQALVALAEGPERAGADDPDDLARPLRVPAALEQLGLEQEAARHVVGGALDRHGVALALRAPLARLLHPRQLRTVLAAADG